MRALPKAALGLLFIAVLLAGGAAALRAQSALDGFDPNANGTIRAVVVQPDGKILIGGDFTTLSPNGGATVTCGHLARLNPDGTLDIAFNPGANGTIRAIVVQADGKILVGGDFFSSGGGNSIGGKPLNFLARLDSTTGAADTFNPNPNSDVQSIAVQADGKILVGGDFNSSNGTPTIGGATRNNIARLDASGVADSFNPNADSTVSAIVVQASGKILAGGTFNSIGGQPRHHIARLDTSGLSDSFAPDPNGIVYAIAVQGDGKILVGGSFGGSVGGQPRSNIARLDATGAADSFKPDANGEVDAIAVQTDGKIIAGGLFTTIGGQPRSQIARLDPTTTGTADSFNPGANAKVVVIAVQADGKILAGGQFATIAPNGGAAVMRNRIARLETDGTLDQALSVFVSGGSSKIFATALQPDGKILIGGDFATLTPNGGAAVPRNHIARLNQDGTLDTINVFDPNANGIVYAIALQPDGRILIGGDFTTLTPNGGATAMYKCIARLNPDGTLDPDFNPGAGNSVINISTIAAQADGKILVGGDFLGIGGQARHHVARLDPTGAADSFNPNASDLIYSVAVQADGKILLGGKFSGTNSIGGQPRHDMARVDPASGAADSFNPEPNKEVDTISIQTDGKTLIGGPFTLLSPNGGSTVPRSYIVRLKTDGTVDTAFSPNAGNHVNNVSTIASQADGKILVGGENSFKRLNNDTGALRNLAVTQTAITWTCGGANPLFTRVTFESSTDNVNYTLLGSGTAAGNNWSLTGLNLSIGQNIYIRARGYYPSGYQNGSESITESVRNAFLPPSPGLIANVSTRLPVGTGDNVLIEGFTVQGPAGSTKKIIVRAIGPSLAPFGITDALANPTLEIHDAGNANAIVASNDDWRVTQVGGIIIADQSAEIAASGFAPGNDLESAIIANLAPGSYTAVVRGVGNSVGTGVVDAYDLSAASPAKLVNIATRGLIQPGDKLMIAGFIVQNAPVQAVVRAIGPSLSAFGITNALPDTTLQLRNGNGAIVVENDDWKVRSDGSSQQAELEATGLQPTNDLEAAFVTTLPPGAYTALVRGKPETTGIGVVQVYFLQ